MPVRLPVCPSFRMEQIGSYGKDFMKFENLVFWDITRRVVVIFTNFSKQILVPICRGQNSKRKNLIFENFSKIRQVSLQSDKNNGFFT